MIATQPQCYTTEEFLEILPALDPMLDYQLESELFPLRLTVAQIVAFGL